MATAYIPDDLMATVIEISKSIGTDKQLFIKEAIEEKLKVEKEKRK